MNKIRKETKNPKLYFKTEEELISSFKEWKERLLLSDWQISIDFSKIVEMWKRFWKLYEKQNIGNEYMESKNFIQKKKILIEQRCSNCKRLLGKFKGQAEIKCPKCGVVNQIGDKDNSKI